MKKIQFIAILLFSCYLMACNNLSTGKYTITGEGLAQYNGDKMQIYICDTTEKGGHILSSTIIQEGCFYFEGTINNPQTIYLSIYDTDDIYKGWKQELILEDSPIKLSFGKTKKDTKIEGANYHSIVHTTIEQNDDVKNALNNLMQFSNSLDKNKKTSEDENKKYHELYQDYKQKEKLAYKNLLEQNSDPLVELFVIQKLRDFKNWEKTLLELESKVGKIPELTILKHQLKKADEAKKIRVKINIGNKVEDFSAKNLNEESFHLKDVLAENKYVLVEFWASWCSPCRAEIPHMKQAYKTHNKNGFEIVSFTLDDNLKSWQKASDDENIPWVNVGDLKAYQSPVVKMYGVMGVPANYLLDNTGTIIAMHLRGEALDNKLKELLK